MKHYKWSDKEIGLDLYKKFDKPKKVIDYNNKKHCVYFFDPKQGDCFSRFGKLVGVIGCDLTWMFN